MGQTWLADPLQKIADRKLPIDRKPRQGIAMSPFVSFISPQSQRCPLLSSRCKILPGDQYDNTQKSSLIERFISMKTRTMTLRTMMIAIAFAVLPINGYVLWKRSIELEVVAIEHEKKAKTNIAIQKLIMYEESPIDKIRRIPIPPFSLDKLPPETHKRWLGYGRLAEHEEGLARKYRRASRYPWIPIEADPVPPYVD